LNAHNSGNDSSEFSIIKKKSSSQSVSGGDDKASSNKSSIHYQPMVARSLCGGMAEEKPKKNFKNINFSNFKQIKGPQSVMMSGIQGGMDNEISEIGSVFQSEMGAVTPRKRTFKIQLDYNISSRQKLANKDMTLEQILNRRKTNKSKNSEELPRLRRKICKKMFEIFYQEKKLEKNESKSLSLVLEELINTKFSYQEKKYMKVIKKLFKSIRVSLSNPIINFSYFSRATKS
jgi:hypothetical protein